jgi:ClpP class serine protease
MKYPKIIAEIERTHWAITPEALEGIKKAVNEGLSAEDYALFHKSEALETFEAEKPLVVGNTGVLVINGPIVPRATAFLRSSGLVAIDRLTEDFKALEADDAVEKILFLVDSPGGAVTGVSDFSQLVKASSKPTSAFVTGQAASAAYWIVSAVDWIVSSDTGLEGSLGVVLAYNKSTSDKEGRIVSAQSPDKRVNPETKEGQAILQKQVNEIADVFVGAVAKNRGVSTETVLQDFGRGAMFVAKRALSVGMIDEIATIDQFMARSKNKEKKELGAQAQNMNQPAIAGEREAAMAMTLAEFLAEHPAAKAEFEAVKTQRFEAGKAENRVQFEKIAKYLQAESYPGPIKALAVRVIKGEISFDALEGAAIAIDSMREERASVEAQKESADLPAPQEIKTVQEPSAEGHIKNEVDLEQFYKDVRGQNDFTEVA